MAGKSDRRVVVTAALLRRIWPALAAAGVLLLILLLVRCSDRAQDSAVEQARHAGAVRRAP